MVEICKEINDTNVTKLSTKEPYLLSVLSERVSEGRKRKPMKEQGSRCSIFISIN